jgi:hypothetical protein
MKPTVRRVFTLLALPAIAFVLGGCVGGGRSGRGYTPVYGDYGYVGPWDNGGVEVEGSFFVAPPNERPDRDRRREAAPVQRAAPHPIPSIPNSPRPARQRGANDKDKR